jgi:membrane-associated phospholipid phosphatase
VALLFKKPWAGFVAGLLATGVALSRVYLFQHFPIDVAFGAFIGMVCSSIFYYLYYETLTK